MYASIYVYLCLFSSIYSYTDYSYLQGDKDTGAGKEVEIKGLLKYLDYGSGRERGARK